MAVIAFVRPEPVFATAAAEPCPAETRLRRAGVALRRVFMTLLVLWVAAQMGCLLSLLCHFKCGIVAGTIDGTIAFRVWPAADGSSGSYGAVDGFRPHDFPAPVAIAYALIASIAAVPFCAALGYLAGLFALFARGEVFTPRSVTVVRRIGHAVLATGYSPFLLGPVAHAIGVLKPVTGVSTAMIACVLFGLVLLALAQVMDIGRRLQQDQEGFL